MKYTKKEIELIAKKTLDSATNNYSYSIFKVVFTLNDLIIRGQFKNKEIATWTAVIHSKSIFGETSDFLTINDETGDPLYLQTKHAVFEIEKINGEYQFKDS